MPMSSDVLGDSRAGDCLLEAGEQGLERAARET